MPSFTRPAAAKVYAEKVSGARADRPELTKVLKRLQAGDAAPAVQR
jgi:DNA invertase Pin-like site-specific DNA recombinase